MVGGRFGEAFRQVETLLRIGPVGHLSDGELVERFLDRREGGEAAFEALVARHGGMVLGVCRNLLGSSDDAEDAFQATFLVLVRQARSIRKRDSLGPWLHGVARRVSLRARRDEARRRAREKIGFRVVGGSGPDESLAATLHDEIARLPEKYRTPIVLCDLEGQTHAEAARRLDWPIGTVSGRLSRARAILRTRIARRGLSMTSAVVAMGVAADSARAGVPPRLVAGSLASASSQIAGRPVAATLSALAGGASRARAVVAIKVAAGLVVTAGLGLGTIASRGPAGGPDTGRAPVATLPPAAISAPTSPPRRQIEDETEILTFALAPDGMTLASGDGRARVTLWDLATGREKTTLRGHSAAVTSVEFTRDGRLLASMSADHTIKVWDPRFGPRGAHGHVAGARRGPRDEPGPRVRRLGPWRPRAGPRRGRPRPGARSLRGMTRREPSSAVQWVEPSHARRADRCVPSTTTSARWIAPIRAP